MNTQTGEHLTTSRISRLLRPLRVKCQKLASYSPETALQRPRGSVVVTYGSSSRQSNADAVERRGEPPLAVIPPPEKLSVLSKLDRSSRDKLELSRRIYDVRDTFRNILQATLASGTNSRRSTPQPNIEVPEGRVRSLAAMCANTIGDNLEDQMSISSEERGGQEVNDEEEQEILDTLYDAVYPQYRKYTIISHAFSIILRHCSSHHTLLAILLDLTISYNQASESRALLRHLLERSLQPSALPGTSTCDITTLDIGHAAHSRYLTNLLDTCCPTTGGVMNARTFTQILGEVICSFSVDHGAQAWTVKATVHLARSLRSMDYSAFLSMCSSVGHFLASHIESSKYNGAIPTHLDPVTSRFGKWLSHACQHLHGISAQPPNVEATEEIGIISDILVRASISGLHRLSGSEDARVLSDAVACLSTMALAPSVAGLLSQPALSSLDSILRAAPVKAESFGILVDVTMPQPSKLGGGSSTLDSIVFAHSTISALERWACVLRGHAYHLLEASLWSSALVHVEHLTPEMGSHYNPAAHHSALIAELGRLRHEIVQRVEAAERRCFTYGRGGSGQAASAQTLRKDTLARDQWRWEDMVGCWVQKTPVRTAGSKRRRDAVEDAQISAKQQQRRRKEERLAAWSAPRNTSPDSDGRRSSVRVRADSIAFDDCTTAARRSGSLTAPHPRSSVAPSSTSTSVDSSRLSTPQDDENRSSSARAAREKAAPSRRLSSFVTILRDAQMNRVVLHADSSDDEGAWLRDTHEPKMRAPIVRSEVCQDEDDADLVDARAMENQPSSDDVLDLFAYRPSEW